MNEWMEREKRFPFKGRENEKILLATLVGVVSWRVLAYPQWLVKLKGT